MIRIATNPKHRITEGFWEGTLGYSHAVLTMVMALGIGVVFHRMIGYRSVPMPLVWFAAASLLAILILGRVARTNRVVHWLTGIPFAVISTATVSILALLGGVLTEKSIQMKFGAPSMWASWPFLISIWCMNLNLVGSVGKRLWPLNYANITYLASHLGLAVAVVGGGISAVSVERQTVVLFHNIPTNKAQTWQGEEVTLPFEVTLREFRMDTFAPTLAFAQEDAKSKDGLRVLNGSELLKSGVSEKVAGHVVTVEKYWPRAVMAGEDWREVPWKSAGPAAYVTVKTPQGDVKKGWVSCGSPESSGALLQVSENSALVMNRPRPKKFQSKVEIRTDARVETKLIEVNKKATAKGLDIYQLSYDEKMGAASPYSVLEVVGDSGLPVVYTGIFTMLFGCLLHLWNGIGGRK